jgi:DNA-binding NtrC family response regulator
MVNRRILLVEDEPRQCDVIAQLLQQYEIVTAFDGEEAVERVGISTYDLVLLDIGLPRMDGIQVLTEIRKRFSQRDLPVIITTVEPESEKLPEAFDRGANDYWQKDQGSEPLLARIRRVLPPHTESDEAIVAETEVMERLLERVDRAARSDAIVLILGESGVGKELIARRIHAKSARAMHPMFPVNCGGIDAGLVASELFGHVKGAFTTAYHDKDGLFKVASGGTLFLDEIGDCDPKVQVKLLRVLEQKTICRLGVTEEIPVNVRCIFATNKNLEQAVLRGQFRDDLYHRISVIELMVPPLRERPGDILPLVRYCLRENGEGEVELSQSMCQRLMAYRWPGNVRELSKTVKSAVIMGGSDGVEREIGQYLDQRERTVALTDPSSVPLQETIRQITTEKINEALRESEGTITKAAERLGMKESTLRNRMRSLGINAEDFK